MKILVLVSRDSKNPGFGGGELVLSEWSRLLVGAGHQVDLLCSRFPGLPHDDIQGGVRVHRVGAETTLGFSAYLEYFRQYHRRVDVVVEDMLGGARVPFLAPLFVTEPVVSLWFQDHAPLFRRQFPKAILPALTGMERFIVRAHRGCETLVPSGASGQSFVQKGGQADRVTVYSPGVSDGLLGRSEPRGAETRPRRVVFLGKLRRYKSPDVAIRAFALVAPRVPDSTLVVAGRPDDDRYFHELVGQIRSAGLERSVTFERGISEERKRALLESSRVFLSPAPVEGFGIAGLEANACGVPIVGTTGVPVEALQEGVNGFRVAVDDVRAMADRTAQLLTDDDLFRRLSASAAAYAGQFTWERSIQPLLGVLERIERGGAG